MEQNNKERTKLSQLTQEQRQKIKKYGVYSALGVMFVCVMVMLFFPKDVEGERKLLGFNTEVPTPNNEDMVSNKLIAYEKENLDLKAEERKRMMMDIGSYMNNNPEVAKEEELDLLNPEVDNQPKQEYRSGGGSVRPKETIYASTNAYRDMNTTLGNFYEKPKEDPEKEEMQTEIEELKEQLQLQQLPQTGYDDQVALLEKSYELAAKYMPKNKNATTSTTLKEDVVLERNGKAIAMPVGQVEERVVSSLYQPISDTTFIKTLAESDNSGFHTAVGRKSLTTTNTIYACIHENRTIIDGESVRIRLLEAMRAGRYIIPKNSLVTGRAKVVGERLTITITTIEHQRTIIPVNLTIYDSDGQEGIFIPNSMEINAAKEIVANMGSSLGSSINISTDAGAQLASDLGKGLIQGTSQYISKKMRVVKVHLKAGYKLMLFQPKN